MTLAASFRDQHCPSWRLVLDGGKRRAGKCDHRNRKISLSRNFLELFTPDQVRELVLHEIAHALVGKQHGHGKVWRRKAIDLGSSGSRLLPEDFPHPKGPWQGVCAAGHIIDRHRPPVRLFSCAKCSPRFSTKHVFSWTFNGETRTPGGDYAATLKQLGYRVPTS